MMQEKSIFDAAAVRTQAHGSNVVPNFFPATRALHFVQVWCLAVSSMGDFVVTSGADRALRVWQRTEEPFFVEEEKEKRLESLFEADLEVRRTLSLLRLSTRSMRQQWPCKCS